VDLHYKYTKEEVKKVVEPEVANKKRRLTSCLAKKPMPKADTVDLSQAGVLYAQPIVNGFQLVNSTPK
jgi:hypothetical protein